MERMPATLLEFYDQFPDEYSCRAYLQQVRWPDGFVCPRCQRNAASFIRSRRL
jgi:hypothetical protein